MSYDKYSDSVTEYQGESFVKSLYKKSGETWDINEAANFILIKDTTKGIVGSGDLTKSGDSLSLTLTVGKTITSVLQGSYTLLVYQTDTNNVEINNVIAEYKMTYKER